MRPVAVENRSLTGSMHIQPMYGQPRRPIDPLALDAAGRTLLGDIIAGVPWTTALEPAMPLMGSFGGGLARVTPPSISAVPTSGLISVVDAIRRRKAPPLTRLTRVDPDPRGGFVCDQMERFAMARARDPFTQEFVRPNGLAYQASAFLDHTDAGQVDFMLFKGPETSGFEPGDLQAFAAILPYARAAAMSSRGALEIGAAGRAAPFVGRGDPVLHLAFDGTVRDRSIDDARSLGPDVDLSSNRLVLRLSGDQRRLDRALAAALDGGRPALVTVSGAEWRSLRLLVLPVAGLALDVFRTTAALVVALDLARSTRVDEGSLELLAEACALTKRERDVARLVAGGSTPRAAADVLGVTYDTVRMYLKTAYAKLGVHTQVELSNLIARLSVH